MATFFFHLFRLCVSSKYKFIQHQFQFISTKKNNFNDDDYYYWKMVLNDRLIAFIKTKPLWPFAILHYFGDWSMDGRADGWMDWSDDRRSERSIDRSIKESSIKFIINQVQPGSKEEEEERNNRLKIFQ